MSCSQIEYATQTLETTGMELRFVALPKGSRRPEEYTITTTAAAAEDDVTIAVAALPAKLWPGDEFQFTGGSSVKVAAIAEAGATTIMIVPLGAGAAIAIGETATTLASCYAAVTQASPNASPKIEDVTNSLSGTAYEGSTVASNQQLAVTLDLIEGSPGCKLLLDILYEDEYLEREIYARLIFTNGEIYQGVAIPTTGTQQGAVQTKRSLDVNLQFQGCSFVIIHSPNAAVIDWDYEYTPPIDPYDARLASGLMDDGNFSYIDPMTPLLISDPPP